MTYVQFYMHVYKAQADFYFIARYMYRQDTQVYGAHTALWVKWVVTKCVVTVAPTKCETLFTLVLLPK